MAGGGEFTWQKVRRNDRLLVGSAWNNSEGLTVRSSNRDPRNRDLGIEKPLKDLNRTPGGSK